MDYIALGKRIRAARNNCQLTQAVLAEKAGVSVSFIGHIERGTRVVSLDTFARICQALETSPNALLDMLPADGLSNEQHLLLQQLLNCACQLAKSR